MKKYSSTGKPVIRRVVGHVFAWEDPVYTTFTLSNGKVYEYIVPIVEFTSKKAA